MTPAARLAAAIEVFANIESERRPAADALKSWGVSHRFAGSGDRAAIAGLVYDALRRRASSAWLMRADSARVILLGMLKRERGLDLETIAKLADGSNYGPEALSDDERKRLDAADVAGARQVMSPAITRNGSNRISPGFSARPARRKAPRWLSARRSTCASIFCGQSARRRPTWCPT